MSLSFNVIPSDLRVPLFYAEMDNSAANTAQDSGPALLIGHALPGADIQLNSPVIMPSAEMMQAHAGRGSQLHRMVTAYRRIDPIGELWVIAVPEPKGAAASGKITISGTAQDSGVVTLYIGDQRIVASVAKSNTANTVATELSNAINSNQALPVTAAVEAAELTLTARHKGLIGNNIPLALNYYAPAGGEKTPPGINISIEAMSRGTGSPDMSAVITAMGDTLFDFIGLPFNDIANRLKNDYSRSPDMWQRSIAGCYQNNVAWLY